MPRYPAPDRTIFEAALEGLQAQRERLDAQIASVRSQLARRGPGRPASGQAAATSPAPRKRRKRKLSLEGRAAIVAAAKKRWAAVRSMKKAKAAPPAKKTAKKRAAKAAKKSKPATVTVSAES